MTLARKMLNWVGLGEKKVHETADMLNMLMFWGDLRGIFPISSPKFNIFNISNTSAISSTSLSPEPTNIQSNHDSHRGDVKLGGLG